MKKKFLSTLLISSIGLTVPMLVAGCGNAEDNTPDKPSKPNAPQKALAIELASNVKRSGSRLSLKEYDDVHYN
jgi:hypothetical protein